MLVVYDFFSGAVMAIQSTKDSSVETVAAVAQTLETWGHTDVALHAGGEPATKSLVRAIANASDFAKARSVLLVIRARDPSKCAFRFTVESSWQASWLWRRKSAVLKHPAIVWLVRLVAWLMTRYITGRDGCSPFRRIFGQPYGGSICKCGEQVHYKMSGRPSSRVEPRWELGAWVGKMELTDEHLLGTLAGIRSSRTIYPDEEPLSQQGCFGSHHWDFDEPQGQTGCGQGSTSQETVHHAEMG